VVSGVIQQGIDQLDESIELIEEETEASISDSESPRDQHVSLGSPLPSTSLEAIEHRSNEDSIFKDFRKNLGKWFSQILNKKIKIALSHSVSALCHHHGQKMLILICKDHPIPASPCQLRINNHMVP
jgi:hypothetical protein